MRHSVLCGCIAALWLGTLLTGGTSRIGAQVRSDTRKVPAVRGPAEKSDPKNAEPARQKSVEIEKQCTISLIDEVTLSCDRPGIIAFVLPREGDAVLSGQLVVSLQDDVPKATLAVADEEARSDVEIRYAVKAGEVARAEYEKVLDANRINEKTFPLVEVERLRLAAEKTVLEKESAEHRQQVNRLKRDEAQAQLETYRIKAPFDGVVTRAHRSPGEAVRQGDQVLELASTRRVRVEGAVRIRDVWSVKQGARVQVRLDIPDVDLEIEKQIFTGRVVFVDVKAEPVSATVRVWAEVDNPDNLLRAGLFARMTILVDSE
jgi:RND family efflux transporter MFP subunit